MPNVPKETGVEEITEAGPEFRSADTKDISEQGRVRGAPGESPGETEQITFPSGSR